MKLELITNGKHKGTKLLVNGNPIKFEALTISGDKNIDYDIVLSLTQSKATKEQVKQESGCVEALGFQVSQVEDDDEYFEDE